MSLLDFSGVHLNHHGRPDRVGRKLLTLIAGVYQLAPIIIAI